MSNAKGVLIMLVAFMLWGCGTKTVQLTPDISVRDIPSDKPEFKREYKVQINSQVSMTVTAKTWFHWGSYYSGELDQTGGKWVLFDPKDPADKILDREILPTVEVRCREIIAADEQFRDSKPSEFVDENGDHWRKVQS